MSRYFSVIALFATFLSTVKGLLPHGSPSVKCSSLSEGVLSNYLFQLRTEVGIQSNAAFRIEFPPQITSFDQNLETFLQKNDDQFYQTSWEKISDVPLVLSIPMPGISIANYKLAFSEIMNPLSANSTANFKVMTYMDDTLIEENSDFEGVPLALRPGLIF